MQISFTVQFDQEKRLMMALTKPKNFTWRTSTSVVWDSVLINIRKFLGVWRTNPRRQVAVTTKFCTMAPNICGPSTRNSLPVTLQASGIFRWPVGFLETLCTVTVGYVQTAILPWSNAAQNTALGESDGGIMGSVIVYTGMWMKTFRRKTLSPASGWTGVWLDVAIPVSHYSEPEDRSSTLLRNIYNTTIITTTAAASVVQR